MRYLFPLRVQPLSDHLTGCLVELEHFSDPEDGDDTGRLAPF